MTIGCAPIVLNADGRFPGLLVVDHAGTDVPDFIDGCDLERNWRGTHHFCDLGAVALARAIGIRLDIPIVMGSVSRLIIDLNRWLDDPRSIASSVEGDVIVANEGLDPIARLRRHEQIFWPYHETVARYWDAICHQHRDPVFLALHTCTRVFQGERRIWDGGTIWHDDMRLSRQLLGTLAQDSCLTLGDNRPYSGRDGLFTVDRHTYGSGLRACGFEVSNDMLETSDGVASWADALSGALVLITGCNDGSD